LLSTVFDFTFFNKVPKIAGDRLMRSTDIFFDIVAGLWSDAE